MKNPPIFNSLASDNFSGIHPEVLAAIHQANEGHAMAYGADPWNQRATELFQEIFGSSAEAFIVYNGTAANVCALTHLFSSWQAVICAESAHIWTDECGATQAVSGCSLLPVSSEQGKLSPDLLEAFLHLRGNQHHVQPAAISITQSTEWGTLYSLEELRKIAQFAREHALFLHMDGARLYNAAAALNVPLKALTSDIGIDILSLGGTKNGLMGAEAIIFLKPGLAENFQYVRKQRMQLASKMRFLAAQYIALLEGDLWLRNAHHSNAMAQLLEKTIRRDFPELHILYPVEANALFVQLPSHALYELQQKHFFWIWDEKRSVARWMTGWDTQPAFIEKFCNDLQKILARKSSKHSTKNCINSKTMLN